MEQIGQNWLIDPQTRRQFLRRATAVGAGALGLEAALAACENTAPAPKPWEALTAREKTAYLNGRFESITKAVATKIDTYAHAHPAQSFLPDGTQAQQPSTPDNETIWIPATSTIPKTTKGEYKFQVVAYRFSKDGHPDLSTIAAISDQVVAQSGEQTDGAPDLSVNHHMYIARTDQGWIIDLQEPPAQNSLAQDSVIMNTTQPDNFSPGFVDAVEARFNAVFADAIQQPHPEPVGSLPAPMK